MAALVMTRNRVSPRRSPRVPKARNLQADLARARWVAELLDTKFSIGGIRFGIEGLLGLLPVAGDTLGAVAGLYPLWIANRHELGKGVQARMAANLLVEWGVGMIPWAGDLFDVAFKANVRNFRLLENAAAKADGAPPTRSAI